MDFLTEQCGDFSPGAGDLASIMGFGNPGEPEKKEIRPENRGDAIRLVEKIYRHNNWQASEIRTNCEMVKVPYKAKVSDYANDELKLILDDMEKYRMIIFEN